MHIGVRSLQVPVCWALGHAHEVAAILNPSRLRRLPTRRSHSQASTATSASAESRHADSGIAHWPRPRLERVVSCYLTMHAAHDCILGHL